MNMVKITVVYVKVIFINHNYPYKKYCDVSDGICQSSMILPSDTITVPWYMCDFGHFVKVLCSAHMQADITNPRL